MVTLSFTVDSKTAKQLVEAYENITSEKCTEAVEPIEIKTETVKPIEVKPEEPVVVPTEEEITEEVRHVDLDTVRKVMAERSMHGEKEAMKQMLSDMGLKKISEANQEQLDALWSQLQ